MCPENAAFLAGDKALFDEFNRRARAILYRRYALADPATRDQIIQETWVAVLRSFLAAKGCVTQFFFSVLQKKAVDWIRQEVARRKHEQSPRREGETGDPLGTLITAEEDAAATAALSFKIPECFKKLNEDQKVLAGLSYPIDWNPKPAPDEAGTLEELAEKIKRRVPIAEVIEQYVNWLKANHPEMPEPTESSVRAKLDRLIEFLNECTGFAIWWRKPPSPEKLRERHTGPHE